MTVDLRAMARKPVTLPVVLDCFETRTGRPVRQKFSMEAQVAVDRGGDIPVVAEIDWEMHYRGLVRHDFLGIDGRTYTPFRTTYPSSLITTRAAFVSLDEEFRVASRLLSDCHPLKERLEKLGHRNIFSDLHRSTGDTLKAEPGSFTATRFDTSTWRLDDQGRAAVEAFRRFVFEEAMFSPRGLEVRTTLPVWEVDPRKSGVALLMKKSDGYSWHTPWHFAASRADDARRFQEVLSGLTRAPVLPSQSNVLRIDEGWDRRNDLVEMAKALAETHVPSLAKLVPDMPSEAARLWHGLINCGPDLAVEGAPGARRQLEAFVRMREVLEESGGPEFAEWSRGARRQTTRIVEIEGIGRPAAPEFRP